MLNSVHSFLSYKSEELDQGDLAAASDYYERALVGIG